MRRSRDERLAQSQCAHSCDTCPVCDVALAPIDEYALWDAINRYAVACGGDPSKDVYGTTTRQKAVADIGQALRRRAVR